MPGLHHRNVPDSDSTMSLKAGKKTKLTLGIQAEPSERHGIVKKC